MKINKFFALLTSVAILAPTLAFGATLKAGEEVSVKNPIADNLYAAGGNVSIDSVISGDLFTAGGNVIISENISDDINALGGSISVLGSSGDDTRIVGGNVLISNNVGGELIVIGGSVNVSSGTSVAGDLVSAGGLVAVNGNIGGNAKIAGGVININGHIKGNVVVKADEKITIGENAVIDGNLEYSASSAESLKIEEGAVISGKTTFTEIALPKVDAQKAKSFFFAFIGIFTIYKLLAFIISALILFLLFKEFSNSVSKNATQNPLRLIGKGFVALIVIPAAFILLFITVLGIPLGLLALLSYVLLLFISCIYTNIIFGAWISQLVYKSSTAVVTWKNIIIGSILLAVIVIIPFIGWIIGFLIFLLSLGTIADLIQKKLWSER
ncbi:MAG: hypothetical protein WC435_00380 [Candidatus Paceibacterota bacterium]